MFEMLNVKYLSQVSETLPLDEALEKIHASVLNIPTDDYEKVLVYAYSHEADRKGRIGFLILTTAAVNNPRKADTVFIVSPFLAPVALYRNNPSLSAVFTTV